MPGAQDMVAEHSEAAGEKGEVEKAEAAEDQENTAAAAADEERGEVEKAVPRGPGAQRQRPRPGARSRDRDPVTGLGARVQGCPGARDRGGPGGSGGGPGGNGLTRPDSLWS